MCHNKYMKRKRYSHDPLLQVTLQKGAATAAAATWSISSSAF